MTTHDVFGQVPLLEKHDTARGPALLERANGAEQAT